MPAPRLSRLLAVLLVAPLLAAAEVKLAALFSDHVVLQRDTPVPVWGTDRKGATVTVAFRGQQLSTKADRDGRWRVDLAPLAASAEPADLVVTGSSSVTVRDVLVGDVWICSGQSNMEWPVRLALQPEAEAAAAMHPLIRHFKVERKIAHAPEAEVAGAWTVCTPETAPHFTAVGYFFARDLQREIGVPIGLLNTTWGGTPVESWMSPAMLAAARQDAAIAAHWQRIVEEYPAKKAAYDQKLADWEKRAAEAKAAGQPEPAGRPWRPAGPGLPEEPTTLWNGMVAPLVPFAFRGVLWYQGESNVGRDAQYRDLFPALIDGWRTAWAAAMTPPPPKGARKNEPVAAPPAAPAPFPFLFVQIANYADGQPGSDAWARLREAQNAALALPATGGAVIIDIGDANDIHPRNKQEVGRRLALIARAKVYEQGVDFSGPVAVSHTVEGATIRVRFDHAQIGLVCHGPRLQGFQIAGADRIFRPATARLERDTVVVSADDVPQPVAVRYAFTNDPQPPANLYNGAGLPAAPFRTDSW